MLGLILAILPAGAPLVLVADDTLERRNGRKIRAKGCDRDAVRSSQKHPVRCFGLKWVTMSVLVLMPWGGRVWALPVLTALCPPASKGPRFKGERAHKTTIDWARQMALQVRRWAPDRRIILVVLGFVVGRWSLEVTFAEMQAHLGMETQRQWSDLAIARTTPVLMGLFSVVSVLAVHWHGRGEMLSCGSAWYAKGEPTFSDCLALTRQKIWRNQLSRVYLTEMTCFNCPNRFGKPQFRPSPQRRKAKVR